MEVGKLYSVCHKWLLPHSLSEFWSNCGTVLYLGEDINNAFLAAFIAAFSSDLPLPVTMISIEFPSFCTNKVLSKEKLSFLFKL